MKSYLSLIPITARVRRRQNRMTLLCIVIAVFLVTTVFSMVGMLVDMEKTRMIQSHGHWHVSVQNISEELAAQIASRSDVRTAARCESVNSEADGSYFIGSQKAVLYGADEAWLTDIWDGLEEGFWPRSDTQVIVSPNAKSTLGVKIGGSIVLVTPAGSREYTVSGFGTHDPDLNEMFDGITVYMNRAAFSGLCEANGIEEVPVYYIRFSTDRAAAGRIRSLREDYGIPAESVRENTALLAVMGASSNEYAQTLYPLAAVLFVLVLLAGVFMISSSMNSNAAQRTQFFGMMRCIGMSKRQITAYVRLEALNWCRTSIPIGIVLGILSTWGLCLWLKYGIRGELTGLPLFRVDLTGIALGAAAGVLSVLIAAGSPAKRAARVTPAAAASGNAESAAGVRRTRLADGARIDTALGISHAMSAKKNLILMTCSFALSIILFFGFLAGIDFVKTIMPTTRSWQPDFSISSDDETNSVDKSLAAELSGLAGVSRVYGNMAAMDVPAVSEKGVGRVTLVSYDAYMLQCAEESRVDGDPSRLSDGGSLCLTICDAVNPLQTGDIVQVGGVGLEVAGTVSEGLFEDDITLICTEETFERLMGSSGYALLNLQAADGADRAELTASIRGLLKDSYSLADYYDITRENRTEFWGFRIVVYGFLAIIVFMAALNIMNSTAMSVSARVRQYGVMRAVGMDGRQLTGMIAAEVFTYTLCGCVIGCAFGWLLHRAVYEAFITAYFGRPWRIPLGETALILSIIIASSAAAVYGPAKRIRDMAVTAVIGEL